MNDDEIRDLTEAEVSKIERVNNSIAAREEAEAVEESAQARRILFQRAAADALPFIVYVLTMGAVSILGLVRLLAFDGPKLWIGAGLLILLAYAPILILPRRSLWWLRKKFTTGSEESREAS